MAHDFNNLLTVIKSSVEFMQPPDLVEERRARYLSVVSETIDLAAKLTSQLLPFVVRQALKPKVFDIGKRLHRVPDMLNAVTGTHRHAGAVP